MIQSEEATGGRVAHRLHGRDHLGLPVFPPTKTYPDWGDHDPGAGVVAPRAEIPGPGEEADDEPGRAARATGGSCLHDVSLREQHRGRPVPDPTGVAASLLVRRRWPRARHLAVLRIWP